MLGAADLADFVAGREEGVDHFGIPLSAGAGPEDFVELFIRHSLAIWPVARHGVERIGHGDDPRKQWYFGPFQSQRIAGAVPRFMMMPHRRKHGSKLLQVFQNSIANFGVQLDVFVFRFGQAAWLAENAGRRCQFCRCRARARLNRRFPTRLRVAAHLVGQPDGDSGHAIAVAAGIRIFGVDGGSKSPHHTGQEIGLFAIELDVARMNAENGGHG